MTEITEDCTINEGEYVVRSGTPTITVNGGYVSTEGTSAPTITLNDGIVATRDTSRPMITVNGGKVFTTDTSRPTIAANGGTVYTGDISTRTITVNSDETDTACNEVMPEQKLSMLGIASAVLCFLGTVVLVLAIMIGISSDRFAESSGMAALAVIMSVAGLLLVSVVTHVLALCLGVFGILQKNRLLRCLAVAGAAISAIVLAAMLAFFYWAAHRNAVAACVVMIALP